MGSSAADEGDRWARKEQPAAAAAPAERAPGERPRLKLQPRTTKGPSDGTESAAVAEVDDGKPKKPSPFGAAKPVTVNVREEPPPKKEEPSVKEAARAEAPLVR